MVLFVQIVLTFAVVGFCGGKLLNDNITPDEKILYASTATGMIARWMPTPGNNSNKNNIGQVNVDSTIERQIDNNP